MTRRYPRGMVALSVLFGMAVGLSACAGGAGTSSPPAFASKAALAAAPAAAPERTMAGPLPAMLSVVVGDGSLIVGDQFGYLPGPKKMAVPRKRVSSQAASG
jgi:hypothetical protein